jgi:IS5 family transposase
VEDKLLRCRKLRIDTTVIEADIDHPTDADLLEHGVRKLGRLVRRIKEVGAARRTRFRDRSRSAGRRLKEISRTLRWRTGQALGEIDRLTGEVAAIAAATLRDVAAVEHNARRALRGRPSGRLAHLIGELTETVAGTRRLLEQTALRLAGTRTIPDRLVSLADPDARPIRKGKPQHPTQFGYTALVAEAENGFVADHQVHRGNPADAPQLVPSLKRVTALVGRVPGTVVADRGFGTAANDRALAELGVRRIGLQRKGTPGKARREYERSRPFRRMRNWRVGIEARISHLKRSFGFRRTRLRRLSGARTWAGLGIFAYNLHRMTVLSR